MSLPPDRLAVIDLFAGAGGMGLGFSMAGFEVPLSLEIDSWACATLRHNHPDMIVLETDITQYDSPDSVRAECRLRPQIIVGGPPCQGFSIAGPAQKDPNDPRNTLFMHFARWVEALEPDAFVMENVKGLLARKNANNDRVIDIIKRTFQELGYNVDVWLLNAANYGVPQVRERVFVVGNRFGKSITAPSPTHVRTTGEVGHGQTLHLPGFEDHTGDAAISLWDAISDLPSLAAGEGHEEQPYREEPRTTYQRWARSENFTLFNHVAMEHSDRLVERFRHISWGQSSSDVPHEHGARKRNGEGEISASRYDQNNRRLHPSKPSHTIAASFYANFLHPFQHRNLTVREGARVQSFPDSYRFLGKKTTVSHKLLHREGRHSERYLCQYNQVGNAVPPLLARAIARKLREELF